jgi:hypothetical protein
VPEIISKVLIHNPNSMDIKKIRLESISVVYSGQNPLTGKYQAMLLTITNAIEKGETFVDENKITFSLGEEDKLKFQVYKHCRHLDIKIESNYEFTMKEMVNICPMILIDLIKNKGGIDYLAKVLIGYEELYNQQNK